MAFNQRVCFSHRYKLRIRIFRSNWRLRKDAYRYIERGDSHLLEDVHCYRRNDDEGDFCVTLVCVFVSIERWMMALCEFTTNLRSSVYSVVATTS